MTNGSNGIRIFIMCAFETFIFQTTTLGVLFGQVSTFLKDSTTYVYGLGGL